MNIKTWQSLETIEFLEPVDTKKFNTIVVSPGIEKIIGVSGVDAYIIGTNLPVWALVDFRRLGLSEEEILIGFPYLSITDLHNAWFYAEKAPEEIAKAIDKNNGLDEKKDTDNSRNTSYCLIPLMMTGNPIKNPIVSMF
ncbi:MAG: DUF433 domain-containing protein [Microcoleaceae cyanobacterium]|jgi:uncharacterized protein (DUF433 family)